jgi:hypothetical protein
MGLTDAIRRFFRADSGTAEPGSRIAELVREERALLEQALAGANYELHDEDVDRCRIVTDRLTITFGWWWRERWITAAIRLNRPQEVPLEFDFGIEYETRAWLEAAGMPTIPPRSGVRSASLVRDEMEFLGQAVALLSDDRKAREAIFYMDGNGQGYTDRVLVRDELPPDPVIVWVEETLRRRGRTVSMPRAGEGR